MAQTFDVTPTPEDQKATDPNQLLPKRNPNLIQRIAALINRSTPQVGPQAPQRKTTNSGVTVQALQNVFDQYMRSQSDRLAIYTDVDEMDQISEECSVALDTIADNVTTSEDGQQMSFDIDCEDEAANEIFHQVNQDADLHKTVYSMVRNLVKYGDMFAEIVVNGEARITEIRQLPPSTMWRNQDQRGQLTIGQPRYDQASGQCLNKTRECAFEQKAEDTQSIVAAFWPWQIVHSRLNWDGWKPYGRSHLRVARVIWKKLHAIEEAMIIARLARAYPKYRHKVDTTGLAPPDARAKLLEYSQSVNQRQAVDGRRYQQYWVLSDLFLAINKITGEDGKLYENASDIAVLESKGDSIFQITDVKDYFHRKLLITLRVPPAHMGWEEQVNAKATLGQQDVQYIRYLRRLQQLVGQALEQIYDTALLLAGMDPDKVDYSISWPMLSATDEAAAADAEFSRAQADSVYAQLQVIDREWLQKSRFDLTDEEIEEMNQRVKAEMDEEAEAAAAQAQAKAAAEPEEDEDEEEEPEEKEPQAATAESNGHAHNDGDDEDSLELAWSDAARRAAAQARRGKAFSRRQLGVKVHGAFKGRHSHAHAHGSRVHTHSHAHSGTSSHAHSHSGSGGHLRGEGGEEFAELIPQAPPRERSEQVTLLASAIRGRAAALLEPDLGRVLEEQKAALQEARRLSEE